jgi:hypothetical protein
MMKKVYITLVREKIYFIGTWNGLRDSRLNSDSHVNMFKFEVIFYKTLLLFQLKFNHLFLKVP